MKLPSKKEAGDIFSHATVQLLFKEPFFGSLVMMLDPVEAGDWCKSIATNGRKIFYNPTFLAKADACGEHTIKFLLAHIVLHIAYNHNDPERIGGRNKQIWDIACDHQVNLELVDCGLHLPPKKLMDGEACCDNRFNNMAVEEIYTILLKEQQEQNGQGGQGGEGGDEEGEQQPGDQSFNSKDGTQTLDSHLKKQDVTSGTRDSDEVDNGDDSFEGQVALTESEAEELRQEWEELVIQSAKAAAANDPNGKGIPGSIARLVKSLGEPTVDWNEILHQQIQASAKSDYDWSVGNRKTRQQGIHLPSMANDSSSVNVICCIDVSGSVSEEMFHGFLQEVVGMVESFAEFKIGVICFDTLCHGLHLFDENSIDEITSIDFQSGGGNNGFDFVVDFIEEQSFEFEIDNLVVFTDFHLFGPTHDKSNPPYYADDTTWCIWGHKEAAPDMGSTIWLPDSVQR